MNKIRISALSTLLLVGQMSANATVLFDNLGDTLDVGSGPFTSSLWGGQSFNSGTADTLTSLQLNLFESGTGDGDGVGFFFVRLYSRSGDVPNSLVATIATHLDITTLGIVNSTLVTLSGLSQALTPSTSYFIVVGAESGGGGLLWGHTATGQSGLPPSTTFDSGGLWFATAGANRMHVEGDVSAVPEPAGYMAASLLALFGVGHFGRSYLRRKAATQA